MITASLRATAISAFFSELRAASRVPHAFSAVHCVVRLSITLAAAKSAVRVKVSPHRVMRPRRSTSPDWYCRGVSPRCAPTSAERRNRSGRSTVVLNASAVTGPTPGIVMKRRPSSSFFTTLSSARCSRFSSRRSTSRAVSSASMQRTSIGRFPTSSRTRASYPAAPIRPSSPPKWSTRWSSLPLGRRTPAPGRRRGRCRRGTSSSE
jgi:hypothetical protein